MLRNSLLAFLFFVFAGTLTAHDLYLQPGSFYLEKPGTVGLEMLLTEERFPGVQLTWRGDKTVHLKSLGPSGIKEIPNSGNENPMIPLEENGTHQIGWDARITYISINPVTFNKYINLEGYRNAIEARKKGDVKNAFGRERYSRYIKTFVQVGLKKTDDFKKPLGFKIEIIPQSNPTSLKVGDELQVQVLFDGKPLAMNRIMATYDEYSTKQEDYAETLETGADGMVRFKITNPGLWLIRTNYMLPAEGDEKAEWESFWSNITFQVQ